jgi:uncharacterized protein YbjT (DUF2867 family)
MRRRQAILAALTCVAAGIWVAAGSALAAQAPAAARRPAATGAAPISRPATAAMRAAANDTPVLVFGGSGQLGSQIVRQLVEDGYPVWIFIRPTSDRARIEGLPVNLVQGNVLNDADVERALRQQHFKVIVNALGRSESGVEFYATSGRLIAHWAKVTGVEQVILHSSVGVGDSRAAYPPGMLPQRSALFEAKQVAEDDLITSGITFTIIRNAVLQDIAPGARDGAHLYEDQRRFGAVSRRGLARLTRDCVGNPVCANRIYHAIDAGMRVEP